ncbi:MAG TPA: RteC domain-containing protein [Puia sp.]|jgi:hypothetical protein|nr:RteC domain-containing protein [Puia sp.]
MTKPFDIIYSDLQKGLKAADRRDGGPDRYREGISMIRESIGKLRSLGTKFMKDEAKEIEFFRDIWPAFYSKLFLYIRLYGLELSRGMVPADGWPALISKEEDKAVAFFRSNREFWCYYRGGGGSIDGQFTRAYSRNRILEPLALVIDADTTLASYRAACCLAMYEYVEYLREERASLAVGRVSATDLGYSWGGSDADLAEWLFGIQAVGAVQYQGQPADISRLQKWARLALGREVANIYDRGRVLRNRKKERLAFHKKTEAALEKKWNEAEGKFE